VFAALAEFERNLIRERTLAGLRAARARGRNGGRPKKLSPKGTEDNSNAAALGRRARTGYRRAVRRESVDPVPQYDRIDHVKTFGESRDQMAPGDITVGSTPGGGVRLCAHGVGGDLDVVAAAEGKLVYLELKSAPPKHLSDAEVRAFVHRLRVLRPDITLFVMDTALRLSDKVVSMLVAELQRRSLDVSITARRVRRELWALTPHVYAVNSNPDRMRNIGRAIAEGLAALAPTAP
jgi:resolvase-like protein